MANYWRKSTDIAGYTYQADIYCPECTQTIAAHGLEDKVPQGDPWQNTGTGEQSAEDLLDRWAQSLGIDRYDERSYDSDDFPKVVFDDSLLEEGEVCGNCYGPL